MYIAPGLGYHAYEGVALDTAERDRIAKDLDARHSLILRNHGTLMCGRTVADAFLLAYILERACEVQVRPQSGGGELVTVPDDIARAVYAAGRTAMRDAGGAVAWPGLLRKLDRVDPSWQT